MFLDQTQLLILHERLGDADVTIRVLLKTQPAEQARLGRHYRGLVKTAFDRAGIALPNPRRLLLVPPRQEALV